MNRATKATLILIVIIILMALCFIHYLVPVIYAGIIFLGIFWILIYDTLD